MVIQNQWAAKEQVNWREFYQEFFLKGSQTALSSLSGPEWGDLIAVNHGARLRHLETYLSGSKVTNTTTPQTLVFILFRKRLKYMWSLYKNYYSYHLLTIALCLTNKASSNRTRRWCWSHLTIVKAEACTAEHHHPSSWG